MASEINKELSKTKEGLLIPIAIMTEVGGLHIPSPQSIGVSPVASMMDPTSPQLSMLSGGRNGEMSVHSAHDDIAATLAAVAAGRPPSYASEIREVLSGLTVQSGPNGEISVHGPCDDVAVPVAAVVAVAVDPFSFEEEEQEDMFSCAMFSPICSGSCEDDDNDILPDYGDEVQVQVEPPLSPCPSGTATTMVVVQKQLPPLSPTHSTVVNDPPPMLSPSSTNSMASNEEPLSPGMSMVLSGEPPVSSPMSAVTSVVSNGTKASNDESKVASVKSLIIDSDEDDSHDDDDKEEEEDGEKINVEAANTRRRKVQFVETNPTPLSPLSIHDEDFSPRSQKSDMESMFSPRNDDEETITLEGYRDDEDEPDRCDMNDDEGLLAKAKLPSTAGITPRKLPKVLEIRDDESEASMMVLMRYMGCTPVAYGDGATLPTGAQWLDNTGSSPSGRKFVFDSFDDNSLLSDEEYMDDEATYATNASNHQDVLRTTWTYNEEGVEIGLEDLVLASPPMSPRSPKSLRSPRSPKSIRSPKSRRSHTSLTSPRSPQSVTSPNSLASPKSPMSDASVMSHMSLSPREKAMEDDVIKMMKAKAKAEKKKKATKGSKKKPNLTVDTEEASTNPNSRKKGKSKKKSTSPKSDEEFQPKLLTVDTDDSSVNLNSRKKGKTKKKSASPRSPKSTDRSDGYKVVVSDDELSDEEELLQQNLTVDTDDSSVNPNSRKKGKSKNLTVDTEEASTTNPNSRKKGKSKKKSTSPNSAESDRSNKSQSLDKEAVMSDGVLSDEELHAFLSDDEPAVVSKKASSKKDGKSKAKKSNEKDPDAKKSDEKKIAHKKSMNKDTNDADQEENAVLSDMVLSALEIHASLSDDEPAARSDKKTTSSSRKDAKVKAKKSDKDPAVKKSKSSLKKSRNKDANDQAEQVEGKEHADKATDRANEDAAIKKTTTSKSSRRQVSSEALAALDRYRREKEVRASTPRSSVGTPRAGTPRWSSDKKAAIIAETKTTADKKAMVEKKADKKADSAVKPTTKLDKKSSGSSMKEKNAVASSSSGMEEKKSSGTSKKKKKFASSSSMEEKKKVASPSREEQERVANSLLNKKKAKDASDKKTRVASNKSLEKKMVSSSEKREVASSDKKSKSTKTTASASSSADSSKKKKKKKILAVAVEPQDQAVAVDDTDRPMTTKSCKSISLSSTMPIHPDIIGTYLCSPKTGVEKEPLISGLSQSALSPRQLVTALSPRSTPVSSPTSVGNRAVPVVDTKDDVPSNNKEPKKDHATSVSAMAAASIAAAEASASKKKEHAASVSAMAAAAIAAAEASASKKKERAASVSAVASAMAAAAMAAAEVSVSKSKFTSPPNKDDTALQDIGKLEESPTTRSDKENSSDSDTSSDKATPPLMVVTASAAATTSQAVPPASDSGSRTQQPRSALSPTKKSVRDVDELLSKTRNWLISHNESQLTKNQVPRTSSLSSSERRVMGNITAKTVLNSGNGSLSGGSGSGGNSSSSSAVSSTAALKVQQSSSSKPLSSGLMDQRKLSGNATTTTGNTSAASILSSSSTSSSSMTAPKKSILEQLGEIRAKQHELELRQKAKHQRAK